MALFGGMRDAKFLAAIKPISNKKKANIPLNKSIENGAIIFWPSAPLSKPTTIDPNNKSWAPSVNDSCKIEDMPIRLQFGF